jgi:zinc protease
MVDGIADRIVQNRLDARLKTSGAPFSSAAIGSGIFLNRIRYAEISADSNAKNWSQTLGELEQTLRRARHYGFTETELMRVKKETLKRLDNAAREAPTRNSTTLARTIIRSLSQNRVIQSPAQEKARMSPLIEAVTLEEIHQAFKENWPDSHRLVLVTGNLDLKPSSTNAATSLIRDSYLSAASTVVYPPEAKAIATFPYLPEPQEMGTIASREVLEDLGITRVRFGNGIRVNLKRTDYKTNQVLANLIFGHGKSAEPIDLPGLSLLAEATINESGLGAMDTDQLERALAGSSTNLQFGITENYFKYVIKSVTYEMDLLFQLLRAHLMDPGFREDAMLLARERLRQNYQTYSRSIEGMMQIKGLTLLAGGDHRFGMPPFENIRAIDLDDIRNWIKPQLNNAPLELSVVGDIDEHEVIQLAMRYLGTLPDRGEDDGIHRADLPYLPTGTLNRIDVETQIPKALVVAAWQTEDFWNINRTRRLSVLADVFSERLRQRIREKLGASYSPYAFNRASRAYAGYGVFQAHVNVAPDQTDNVLNEVKAIAEDLILNGVTVDELNRAIDPILTSIKAFRQTNEYWLNSVMTGSSRAPQQFEWARSFVEDYGAVTKEELAALTATYLTDDRSAAIIIQPMNENK